MARGRLLLFRALTLAAATGLAVLAGELVLRVIGYTGSGERLARSFDATYANVRTDSWIFDFAVDPAKHRLVDLRGQTMRLPKPSGERRVLFIGDSATEGAFVPLEASFPRVFQQLLDRRRPDNRINAVNAGVWGMSTIDEYRLLADKLLPLAPDVVVLGLFMPNDINWNLGHPRRRLEYRAPRPIDRLRRSSALAHFLFLQALAWNERSRLFSAEDFGRSWVPVELTRVDEYGFNMLSYPAGEVALYMRRPSALVEQAYSVLREVLQQFIELGRRHHFEFRVLIIPSPSSVTGRLNVLHHPNILAELRAQGVAVSEEQLDFALPIRRVLSICAELALSCVDPSRDLRPLGLSAFFEGDEHPSVLGHRALARALFASR